MYGNIRLPASYPPFLAARFESPDEPLSCFRIRGGDIIRVHCDGNCRSPIAGTWRQRPWNILRSGRRIPCQERHPAALIVAKQRVKKRKNDEILPSFITFSSPLSFPGEQEGKEENDCDDDPELAKPGEQGYPLFGVKPEFGILCRVPGHDYGTVLSFCHHCPGTHRTDEIIPDIKLGWERYLDVVRFRKGG